jgi:DNA (cytosine-5)-methyltransferase 1
MLRVFEAFSGVGSQRMALRNIGVEHEVVAIAEIDPDALLSYEAIHGEGDDIEIPSREVMIEELTLKNVGYDFKKKKVVLPKGKRLQQLYAADKLSGNLGDISKLTIDEIPDHDLFTYSFPCQDISIAGKGNGLSEGSNTRSSLLWECKRVIEGKKPRFLLLENVKNLVGKKNRPDFDRWLEWLEGQGYTNYWKVVNAKNHLIPQNRERTFVVSILGEHTPFEFPEDKPLDKCLGDLLEEEVDEKYFLSKEIQERFVYKPAYNDIQIIGRLDHYGYDIMNRVYDPNGISPTIATMQGGNLQPKILVVGNTHPSGRGMNGNVYDGLAPTLTTNKGEGVKTLIKGCAMRGRLNEEKKWVQQIEVRKDDLSNTITTAQKDSMVLVELPAVLRKVRTEYGKAIRKAYESGEIKESRHNMTRYEPRPDGITNTLTTVQKDNYLLDEDHQIRKLTPRECWRLMGFTDEDFDKAAQVNSNSQLYKQAGNSIVVNVLEDIFKNLFK